MMNLAHASRTAYRRQPRKPLAALLFSLLATRKQRRELGELDADRLDDIGITSEEAQLESRKPIWDVPGHWTR